MQTSNTKLTPAQEALAYAEKAAGYSYSDIKFPYIGDMLDSLLAEIDGYSSPDFVLRFNFGWLSGSYTSVVDCRSCSYCSQKLNLQVVLDERTDAENDGEPMTREDFVKYLDELNQRAIALESSITVSTPEQKFDAIHGDNA